MKKLMLIVLLLVQPAWAQMKPVAKDAKHSDACAPIGRTEDGKLVYSMKCETLPKPPAPAAAPQAEARPAPEPEPETERTGLFGLSYDRRPKQ